MVGRPRQEVRSPQRFRVQEKVIIREEDNTDYRPICYAYDKNTVESKVGGKYQMNAPFATQVPRFNEYSKENTLIDEYITQSQNQKGEKEPTRKFRSKGKPKGLM